MKFDKQVGFVVIPLMATGAPTGIALWCETPEQCEEVFNQEHGGEGRAHLVSLWRSSEQASRNEIEPRHRAED